MLQTNTTLAPVPTDPQTARVAQEHLRLKGVALAIGIALAQVACTAGPGTSSPNATPSTSGSLPSEPARTPSAECINPPPDLLTLLNQTDPVACYGDSPITVDAQVAPIGAIDCAAVVPAWLACGAWVWLQPIGAHAARIGIVLAATSGPDTAGMFAAIHPDTNLIASDIVGRSLRITGHFDDPAAQTCRETQAPFGGATTPPQQVIASCQAMFVLTAFLSL